MANRVLEFAKLRWPEVNAAVREGRVAVLPAGTIEAHGPHLPLDTDVVIADAVCRGLAERAPDEVVLLPPVLYGFGPHHMDMPGNTTIGWKTLVEHTLDVLRSVAYHGFRRILVVNAHGSNSLLLDLATRLMIVERPDVLAAFVNWWGLSDLRRAVHEVCETPVISHACEVETSVYLAAAPEHVRMDLAEADEGFPTSPHVWRDLAGRPPGDGYKSPIGLMEHWSSWTTNGVRGDPTKATAEKGRRLIAAAAGELADIVAELKAREIRPRRDFHDDGRAPGPIHTSAERSYPGAPHGER